MKKVILTGATGMIGKYILQHCLKSKDIQEVISITRRNSGIVHEKLTEVKPSSFLDYTGLEDHFKNISSAYFCIGVYTGAVPDAQFKEITVDYTIAFADQLKRHSPQANFCFLSGAGADQSEKSRTSFARYKGMAENHLIGLNFGQLHIFRPGYIYPVENRKEPNMVYRLSRSLYPVIKLMGNKYSIKSTELSAAMFKTGMKAADKRILENQDILNLL